MRHIVTIGFALWFLSVGGCATLMRGNSQKLKFNTDPPAAALVVDGAPYTTPATVSLKRNAEHKVVISKDGYRTVTFSMKSTWDGASLGNLILPGGSMGFAADTAGGADKKFYDLPTIKLQSSSDPNAPAIEMFQHRGEFLTKEQYDKVIDEEREEWKHKRIS